MKRFIFIICVLSFLVTGFASVTHADVIDVSSSHHSSDLVSLDADMNCDDAGDENTSLDDCQDCCCIHTHVLAGSLLGVLTTPIHKKEMKIALESIVHSVDSSLLYRPPIA